MQKRTIRNDEAALLKFLISKIPITHYQYQIPLEVSEMDDGGMGSLLLNHHSGRRFGTDLIEAHYYDSAGTLIIVVLVEDDKHDLFELDMWKVDNSPLIKFPTPDKLIFDE
jgi:hypothetical protein